MTDPRPQAGGNAWYAATRRDFVLQTSQAVAAHLNARATTDGWAVQPEQMEEWSASVEMLQSRLNGKSLSVRALYDALSAPTAASFTDVVLEYDLRRRGLRVDAILFAPGLMAVLEFKRKGLGAASRDQLMGYCTSLLEFHQHTRELAQRGMRVVPILVQTTGKGHAPVLSSHRLRTPFEAVVEEPVICGPDTLAQALHLALSARTTDTDVHRDQWLASDFSPSSTLVDAAISLWGDHDVSAIAAHAAPVEAMRQCVNEVHAQIATVRAEGRRRIILVSGAPGAGKTLVGLELAMSRAHRRDGVFVTGNAPLVEVLKKALERSYRTSKSSRGLIVASGYASTHVGRTIANSTFKIVKAHRFLGNPGEQLGSTDGAVLVFDEAQRTYRKGRKVAGHTLADHEADLVLRALEDTHGDGLVVVALLGQNQAINRGEQGAIAWLEAAERRGWEVAVDARTMNLPELAATAAGIDRSAYVPLSHGHLSHSVRCYRNEGLERWVHCMLEGDAAQARKLAKTLDDTGNTVWLTRTLSQAKGWIRRQRVGGERAGIIASAQARRLAAHGLQVDQKPDIGTWMLAPTGDFRSSNMLETVQNQYQIQGMELDWALVCWGADLRWTGTCWAAHKLSGSNWQQDKALQVAQNGYRVLLTRARKGMVVFVARGDDSQLDPTRHPDFYDRTADWLQTCGARPLDDSDAKV